MTIEENTTIPEKNQTELSPGHIYVLEDKDRLICKIGKSINPELRIKNIILNGGLNIGRKYISPILKNLTFEESKLHRKFSSSRLNGEWFDISFEEIISCLNELCVASEQEVEEHRKRSRFDVDKICKAMNERFGTGIKVD